MLLIMLVRHLRKKNTFQFIRLSTEKENEPRPTRRENWNCKYFFTLKIYSSLHRHGQIKFAFVHANKLHIHSN